MEFSDFDKEMMEEALLLALKGEGAVNPNPLVGAVVVKDGRIIGRGWHPEFGKPHAEVYAIEDAGAEVKGADIYVSLEPCSHFGKTPPCAELIIKSGIRRCFIAAGDPNPQVAGRGIKMMREAGVEVCTGLLEQQSREMNRPFEKFITSGKPFVFLKYATTLDGKIAAAGRKGEKISNAQVSEKVHRCRNKFAGILVGINTVKNDDPALDCRLEDGNNPVRFVIDPDLEIDSSFRFVSENNDGKSVVVSSSDFKDSVKADFLAESCGIRFIFLEGRSFEMSEIFSRIGAMGIDSLLIEGGAGVISAVLRDNLYDGGEVFVAPLITGDSEAVAQASGFECSSITDAMRLPVTKVNVYGDNVGFEFYK